VNKRSRRDEKLQKVTAIGLINYYISKGVESMVHRAILRQRERSKPIWVAKEYHNTLHLMSRELGCSMTYLLNRILQKYFDTKDKGDNNANRNI
jgi:hypothetical protein